MDENLLSGRLAALSADEASSLLLDLTRHDPGHFIVAKLPNDDRNIERIHLLRKAVGKVLAWHDIQAMMFSDGRRSLEPLELSEIDRDALADYHSFVDLLTPVGQKLFRLNAEDAQWFWRRQFQTSAEYAAGLEGSKVIKAVRRALELDGIQLPRKQVATHAGEMLALFEAFQSREQVEQSRRAWAWELIVLAEIERRLRANHESPETDSGVVQSVWMSPRDLAGHFKHLTLGAIEKRLERFRARNTEGWLESDERQKNKPRYLYQLHMVKEILDQPNASNSRRTK